MYLQDHLEKLVYFHEVAKKGSIVGASKSLNLTQPSVTKAIKILEEAVQSALFYRKARGVALTPQGEILFKYCGAFFNQLADLEKKMLEPDDPLAGVVRVGTYDSIAIYFWPKFLKDFMVDYPSIDIELSTNRSSVVQSKVESGELDVGLIIEPAPSKYLDVKILAKDVFQLYCSTDIQFDEDLKQNIPLIYMPDALSGKSKKGLKYLLNIEHVFKKQFKTSSLETTKELLINGLGVGLLPSIVAKDAVSRKLIKPLSVKGFPTSGVGEHQIGLVYSKEKAHTGAVQVLLDQLKKRKW